jgi:hypothetical protein
MAVDPAAGGAVFWTSQRSATPNRATSTITGITIPNVTTRPVLTLSLADERQPGTVASEPCQQQKPDGAEQDNRGDPKHPPPEDRDAIRIGTMWRESRLLAAAGEE